MFTVKATYRQETRKFSFRSSTFPTYHELCNQLYRIFPISQNYHLSKLLFSPESSNSARILIAKEIRSADEYEAALSTLKSRVYPSALLKFSVFEENPGRTLSATVLDPSMPRIARTMDASAELLRQPDTHSYDVIGGDVFGNVTSANVSVLTSSPSVSPYHIPPPPVIFSYKSDSMDVDQASGSPAISIATIQPNQYLSPPYSQHHVSELHGDQIKLPLCTVSQAKTEIQALVATFKDDLDRILNKAFGSTSFLQFSTQPLSEVSQTGSYPHHGPVQYCTWCKKQLSSSWFTCKTCAFKSCDSCYNVQASAHQALLGVKHSFSRVVCYDYPSVNSPLHSLQGQTLPIAAAPPADPFIWTPSSTSSSLPTNQHPSSTNASAISALSPAVTYYGASRRGNLLLQPQQASTSSPPSVEPLNQVIPGAYTEEDALLRPPKASESDNRARGTPTAKEVQDLSATAPAVPTRSTAGSSAESSPVHNGVTCDACRHTIVGIRHKCFDCPDYDLCTTCITSGSAERHNPFHVFLDIKEPIRMGTASSGSRERVGDSNDNTMPNEVHNATCDLCDSLIVGVRYKCLNCPDFDTCTSCFTITPEQHPSHSFIRIHRAVDLIPRRPNNANHYATCDECHKPIQGIRYKCMHETCPDFDLCDACEARPIPVHPITHPFLKLKSPDTVLPAISSSAPKAPVVPGLRSISPRPYSPSAQTESRSTSSLRSALRVPSPTYVPPHINGNLYLRSPSPSPTVLTIETRKSTELQYKSRSHSPISGPYNRQTPPPPPRGRSQSYSPLSHTRSGCPRHTSRSRSRYSVTRRYPSSGRDSTSPRQPVAVPDLSADLPQDVASSLGTLSSPLPRLAVVEPLEKLSVSAFMLTDSIEHGSATSTGPVSPQSQRPFKLPPLSLDPSADLFHEFWPRVAQELRHFLQEPVRTSDSSQAVDFDTDATTSGEPANAMPGVTKPQESTSATPSQTAILQADSAAVLIGSSASPDLSVQPPLVSPPSSDVAMVWRDEDIENPSENQVQDTSSKIEVAVAHADVSMVHLSPEEAASRTTSDKPPQDQPVLSAAFVRDNTVPNGQVFPPGAEFVKSWRMVNDGTQDWPETTELVFAAGDSLTRDDVEPSTVKIGTATAGTEINIWTGELKAPDAPGKYVGYWRLSDGHGNLFGPGIWIEINVAALSAQSDSSGESSLASSSIIMPASLNEPLLPQESRSLTRLVSSASSPLVTAPIVPPSDVGVDDSDSDSISLISVPSSNYDDESAWEDSRSHVMVSPHGMEYVVLYDSSSEEDSDEISAL